MGADTAAWAEAGLLYEVVDGVAWLRMNRPEKRNAMDHYPGGHGPDGMGLRDALLDAVHDASEDKAVKVGVITGNGTAFSAGADLRQEGGAIEIPVARRRGPTTGATTASFTAGTGSSRRSGGARHRSSQRSTVPRSEGDASSRWPAT